MISGGLLWALFFIGLSGALCWRWGRKYERFESHLAELRRSDARVQRRTERQEK